MANNSTAFQEQDFSKGIQESVPENAIPEGYLEKAQNVVIGATIEKRKGYRLHGGAIPIRVSSVQAVAPDSLYLSFPVDVNLAALKDQPIIIYGRLSKDLTTSTFSTSTDKGKYLLAPSIDARRVIGAGEVSTILYAEETLLETDDIVAGAALGLSQTDTSNELCEIDEINVNSTTKNITFTTSSTGAPRYFYLYYIDPTDGSYSYHAEDFTSSTSWTVNPTLPNTNYIVRCYNSSGDVIKPDSIVFNSGTGQIVIDWDGVSTAGRVVVICAEPENFIQGDQITPAAGPSPSTSTVNLPAGSIDLNYGFVESYIYTGSSFELVYPDSVTIAADGSVAIVFKNTDIAGYDLRIVWASTNVIAKVGITITGDVKTSDTDLNPQLCVYGISQAEIFTGAQAKDRTGWVTGVDFYRTETYENLLASCGLNTYVLKNAADTDISKTLMPTHMVNLRCRTAALGTEPVIGPAFVSSVVAPARTRGYLHSASVSSAGEVVGDSIAWVSGTTLRITVPLADLVKSSLSPVEANTDYVTISQAPYSWLVGTHQITGFTGTDSVGVTIDIEVPRATSARFDIASGANIKLGIFSDKLDFADPCPFIPGDIIKSSLFPAAGLPVDYVGETDGTSVGVYVTGVTSRIVLTQNFQLICTRPVCDVFGMRLNSNASVDEANLNIVVGDCVRLEGSDAADVAEVTEVWPRNKFIAKVTGAVVDISGAPYDTSELEEGQEFLVIQSGEYTGVQKIASIDTATQFTIEYVGGGSNQDFHIQGPTVSIDTPCSFTDSLNDESTVAVEARWLAIEPPAGTDGSLVNEPRKNQYSGVSGEQPVVRSTMVKDSMYFTNGVDPVWKYDGSNYYRAGIPRWNPCFFSSNYTDTFLTPGQLEAPFIQLKAGSAATGNWPMFGFDSIYFDGDQTSVFTAGEYLTKTVFEEVPTALGLLLPQGKYLIKSVSKSNVSNESLTGTREMTKVSLYETVSTSMYYANGLGYSFRAGLSQYRYYFRLQLVDANNNLVSSSAASSQDSFMSIPTSSGITFKCVGLPKYDIYDFSRFEIEAFRTKQNETTYFRVANRTVPFDAISSGAAQGTRPITLNDGLPDIAIQNSDIDPIASAIAGSELPTNVYPPPIAKYITSVDNRLALAAVTSTPKIELRLVNGESQLPEASDFEGKLFTLRNDNTDTGVVTSLTARITLELKDGASPYITTSSVLLVPYTGANYNCKVIIPGTIAVGTWIYIRHFTSIAGLDVNDQSTYYKSSLRLTGWYQVKENLETAHTVIYANVDRPEIAWNPSTTGGLWTSTYAMNATGWTASKTMSNSTLPSPRIYCLCSVAAGTGAGVWVNNGNTAGYAEGITIPDGIVRGIFYDGSNIYAVGAARYVYKSTDLGATWSAIEIDSLAGFTIPGFTNTGIAYCIAVSGTTILVGTDTGLYISTNSGSSWVKKTTSNGLASNVVQAVAINGTTYFAATASGLSRSTDSGSTWATVQAGDSKCVYVSGTTVFCGASAGIYKSTDSGATFSLSQSISGAGSARSISGTTASNLGVATDAGVYVTTNGGTAWTLWNKAYTGGSDLPTDYVTAIYVSGTTISATGTVQVGCAFENEFYDKNEPNADGITIEIHKASNAAYIPVLTDTDRNYASVTGNSDVSSILNIISLRMANAFNWIAATEASAAWCLAEAGGDYPAGQLNISFPRPLSTTPELQLPATLDSSAVRIFGNGIYRTQGTAVGAIQRYRGSRVCVSYRNYPEMFENPDIEDASKSTNVYDINPADGQDITAIIPLLGSSVSQASQLEGILLVWKTNSIYAVNVQLGTTQKLDTNGVGCGAPYSIAYIYGGLAFATGAGIFFIDRSLKIRNIGEACERTWDTLLSSATISELQGHHHPATSTFKLSSPTGETIVANYDIMQETGLPAFTTFTGTYVTGGWCNFGEQEVYASRYNRVCISRNTGTEQDYRDDGGATIPMIVDFRMTNFGDSTIRKMVRNIGLTFRNYVISHSGIGVSMAVNGQKTWTALDSAKLEADSNRKIQNLKFSLPNTKFNHLQIRLTDSELDRPLEISGIHYRVVGLTPFGIKTAAESTEA